MKITILAVGKLKEKYWKQAITEYEKRLGAYSKIETVSYTHLTLPTKRIV